MTTDVLSTCACVHAVRVIETDVPAFKNLSDWSKKKGLDVYINWAFSKEY